VNEQIPQHCGQPMASATLPPIETSQGQTRLTILDVEGFRCGPCGKEQVNAEGFSITLLAAVSGKLSVLFVKQKGFFRKSSFCPKCGVQLHSLSSQLDRIETTLAIHEGRNVHIRLQTAFIPCGTCGAKLLPRDTATVRELAEVFQEAFDRWV
jgi:hypothetical protein